MFSALIALEDLAARASDVVNDKYGTGSLCVLFKKNVDEILHFSFW